MVFVAKVHVVVRDNAEHVTKAMDEARMRSVGCLAHNLELCIRTGLESQQSIDDAVSTCRRIAAHFSQSTLAQDRLKEIQRTIPGLELHTILQVTHGILHRSNQCSCNCLIDEVSS